MNFRHPITRLMGPLLLGVCGNLHPQPISPYLVGQNVWHNPDETVWARVRESGVGSIRIGGIGYNNNMPSRAVLSGWVKRIKDMGAEPIMQVPHAWAPEQAADLVRYFNMETGARISFWSIGNEPNLHGAVPVAAVAEYYRRLAPAMRDADPAIRIFGPEGAWFDRAYYGPLIGGSLDITGRDSKGRFLIDGVTFHRYPFGNAYSRREVVENGAAGVGKDINSLLALIAAAEAKHGRTGGNRLEWGITEFNISYDNPRPNGVDGHGVHSFLNGQFFAEVFGLGMKHGAKFINTWSMFESGGSRNGTDLGFLDGGGRIPRSSFHHMQLLARHFRGRHAAAAANLKDVRIIAAKSDSGVAVMILNMESAGSRNYTLRLELAPPASGAPLLLQVDAGLKIQHSGDIPAQSTRVLVFNGAGALVRTIGYGIEQARAGRPPESQALTSIQAYRAVEATGRGPTGLAAGEWSILTPDGRQAAAGRGASGPEPGAQAPGSGAYVLKVESGSEVRMGFGPLLRGRTAVPAGGRE